MKGSERRAGASARDRFDELSRAWRHQLRRIWYAGFALSSALFGIGYAAPGLWKLYLGAAAGGVFGIILFARDSPPQYIDAWRAGQEGEKRTERQLRKLDRQHWRVWHDVGTGTRANIDHVVLGVAGVFLLDSKNWLGNVSVTSGVVKITWVEDPDDGWESQRLVGAARAAGAELAGRIHRETGIRPWVQPVIVLWAHFEQRAVEADGVWFVQGTAIREWLTQQAPRLHSTSLSRIATAIGSLAGGA